MELKDHSLGGNQFLGTMVKPPSVVYEKKPIFKPANNLYAAWITLNNPAQYNSYTTEMVKGVVAGFNKASTDRDVVAAVFTGAGDRAFCTGGNTQEYAEYYASRPEEYGQYMDLFNGMVDSILNCKKPVINRINGMRVAGGQEIGMACDVSISADTAVFGQAGPRHGSSPDGGATDFLPLYLSMEDAMWSCISCELWSAYKMKMKGLIHDTVPVLWAKDRDNYVPNPLVVTDKFIKDGEIVYGEFVSDQGAAKAWIKANTTIKLDALDTKIEETVWGLTNLFPGCLQKAIDSVRAKKKFWWDQAKLYNRHWLAANMMGEGYLGFTAFNERKQTGKDTINFVEYRRLLAEGHPMDQELIDAVLPPPNIEIMNKIAGELLKKPKESR